jgi:hypothetical protein
MRIAALGGNAGISVHRNGNNGAAIILVDTMRATSHAVGAALTGVGYLAFEPTSDLPDGRLAIKGRGVSRTLQGPAASEKGQRVLDRLRSSRENGTVLGKTGKLIEFELEQSKPTKKSK